MTRSIFKIILCVKPAATTPLLHSELRIQLIWSLLNCQVSIFNTFKLFCPCPLGCLPMAMLFSFFYTRRLSVWGYRSDAIGLRLSVWRKLCNIIVHLMLWPSGDSCRKCQAYSRRTVFPLNFLFRLSIFPLSSPAHLGCCCKCAATFISK